MHLVFNKFLNQITKSDTNNLTLVKNHGTVILLTFADTDIYLPCVYDLPGTVLSIWDTVVNGTKMPGLMEFNKHYTCFKSL